MSAAVSNRSMVPRPWPLSCSPCASPRVWVEPTTTTGRRDGLRWTMAPTAPRWREAAARAAARLIPADVLWYVDTGAPAVGLTFDDGPSPHTTPELLDVLARHRAHATFFLIGERVRAYPELVAAISAAGHEIGNHLMRDEPSVRLPEQRFARELAEVTALLTPYGPVRWFRP